MNKFVYTIFTVTLVATCLSHAAPNVGEYEDIRADVDDDDDSDINKLLFPYYTVKRVTEINRRDREDERRNNLIPIHHIGGQVIDLERESSSVSSPKNVLISDSMPSSGAGKIPAGSDLEAIKSIAFNNREVKLVGPDRKEVEMKSDVATQMMIALDNLQKEATDAWGHVNKRLDKGWTEFKTMVENAVTKNGDTVKASPTSSSRQLRETSSKDFSSLVMVSDVDGYSMADEDSSKQAESAGSKIKGFFSNIGINEENGKKANEALSKAGASVSEAMTKDIPDALKKAGSAVSEAVTKNIPEAFKDFFG